MLLTLFALLENYQRGIATSGGGSVLVGLPLEDFASLPLACFSLSTSCFHFLTISFARSATSFEACDRSFPTARPALLSCVRC